MLNLHFTLESEFNAHFNVNAIYIEMYSNMFVFLYASIVFIAVSVYVFLRLEAWDVFLCVQSCVHEVSGVQQVHEICLYFCN